MSRKIMIACAVTGSQPSFRKHPGIPITPEQIANSAIDAARAGASMVHIQELRPEVCSLDVGTLNFGEQVFMNTPAHLATMARMILSAGSKPEIEVFEIGHIMLARAMLEEGLLEKPPHFQLCLGIKPAVTGLRPRPRLVKCLVCRRKTKEHQTNRP
jgi:uncharacterized protein (DUF849 family)